MNHLDLHHLIVGPAGHGVTAYALKLAEATGAHVVREETFSADTTTAALPDGPIHVTFTDHLFGPSPSEAVDALLARVGTRPLSVSFHDVPQREEGRVRWERRQAAYLRLAEAATLITVNSHHEAEFLGDRRAHATVIRLPIPRVKSGFEPVRGTVGILGFLYPGKGHEDLIHALKGTDFSLRFLGSVSTGHEAWAQDLEKSAEITGWLSETELAHEMGRIEIPVCAHRHFSASGSLMTWLGAGRTVLASDSPYTREIDTWLPGRITLVSDGEWATAIENFTAGMMDPPDYGWNDVAAQWRKAWLACGLM